MSDDKMASLVEKLEASEARYRAILKLAVDGIIIIDDHGIIESFNAAAERMFGYRAEEMVGKTINRIVPPPDAAKHDDYLARYRETGKGNIIGIGREVEGLRSDGTTFPLELSVSAVRYHGRLIFTGIVRDITERKAAERAREELIEQLEDKNAELERFTYTVSHDLKSPLVTIKGFLGLVEQDAVAGDMERLKSDTKRIGKAADHMRQLLDELLELSRIGRIVNPPEDVPLDELVREVVDLLAGPIKEAGANVTIEPSLPVLWGDRVRLFEVVQNLLENALKFTVDEEQPEITIGARFAGHEHVCFVQDNGIGIEPAYAEKVFGLFEQLDKKRPGTGVGLTLVRRIVGVHRGRAWAESDGVGMGTTVCFTLPSKEDAPMSMRDLADL